MENSCNLIWFNSKSELLSILKTVYNFEFPFTILDINKLMSEHTTQELISSAYIVVLKQGNLLKFYYRDFKKVDLSNSFRDGGGFTETVRDLKVSWKNLGKISKLTVQCDFLGDINFIYKIKVSDFYNIFDIECGLASFHDKMLSEYASISCQSFDDLSNSASDFSWFSYLTGSFIENYLVHGITEGPYQISETEIYKLINLSSIYTLDDNNLILGRTYSMGVYYFSGIFRLSKRSKLNISLDTLKLINDSKTSIAIHYDKGLLV